MDRDAFPPGGRSVRDSLGRGRYERNRAIKTAGAWTWRAYYEQGYSPEVALFDAMTSGGWESILG